MQLGLKTAFVLAAALVSGAAEPIAARWEGAVQIPGRQLRLVIDLAEASDGHWTGSATVPGFGVKGAPLTEIAIKDGEVSFGIKGALGDPKIKGRLAADGTLTGEYVQAGNTAPFTLLRTGPPQVDPLRQSTAVSKELEGEWKGVMDLFGYPINVALKLANVPGGKAAAQFHIVGKRDSTVALDVVIEENGNLLVQSTESGIAYEGRLQKDEISGTYRQGPLEAPLNLRPAPKGASGARP
jgi:hypothetical protein